MFSNRVSSSSILLGFCLFVMVIVLLGLVFSVHAQDVPPEPTPSPAVSGGISPSVLISIYTFFLGSLGVSGIVGILKLFVPAEWNADTIKEWVAVAVSGVFLVAYFLGQGGLFDQGVDLFDKIYPMLIGLIGAFQGSRGVHSLAVKAGIPLFGNQRTP